MASVRKAAAPIKGKGSKGRTLSAAEKREDEMAKREALAMGYRRFLLRERRAKALQAIKDEAKAEAQHRRRLAMREKTLKLALARIEACEQHPTALAVRQLASIAGNKTLHGRARVEAANVLLRLGQYEADPLPA